MKQTRMCHKLPLIEELQDITSAQLIPDTEPDLLVVFLVPFEEFFHANIRNILLLTYGAFNCSKIPNQDICASCCPSLLPSYP